MNKLSFCILAMLFSTSVFAGEYILGVVPQQSPVVLFKKWKPIVDYLSKETGHEILLKTEKSIAVFEAALYQGEYDFAYMNPYHYILATRQQDYVAEVRADKMIRGILVAKGENLDSLLDKEEVQFLFPSPNAFAATLLLKYELLTEFGIDLNKLGNFQYVNSHDSVYKGIARGVGDLGGGIQRTYRDFEKGTDKEKLNVIYKTKAYPSHPFAFRAEMETEVRAEIVSALLNLPKALSENLRIKKMIVVEDSEYKVIRDLEKKLSPKE